MVVDHLTHNRQAQARAIRFAKTDEGVEKGGLNTFGYARPIVTDANLEGSTFFLDGNGNGPIQVRRRLASIQNQIKENAFEFAGVEHSLEIIRGHQGNFGTAKFRFRMDCFDGPANDE